MVSPYYGPYDGWGEPEAVFTDANEAEKYRSMGDMEVTELELALPKRPRPVYHCKECGKVCGTRENPKERWYGGGTVSYYCKRTCSPWRR